MGRAPVMHLQIAILLLSAAAIAYEVLLIRIFSIVQWYHFAAMIISLALLGYGVSGSLLTVWTGRQAGAHRLCWPRVFLVCASSFGVLSVVCVALAQRVPFNPLAVVWEPTQLLYLSVLYLLLTVPFVFVGTAIGLALQRRSEAIGSLYGADLLGAGLGATLLLVGLLWLSVEVCLRLVGILGCLAGIVFAVGWWLRRGSGRAVLIPLSGLLVVAVMPVDWLALRLSQYKALHKALLVPGARVVAERSGPMGLLTLVESPEIPFRHAPGLSLEFRGEIPQQLALFTDGDSMTAVIRSGETELEASFLDFVPAAIGFSVVRQPRVLIVGAGGGDEIELAVRHGATSIDLVEPNPQRLELVSLARTLGSPRGVSSYGVEAQHQGVRGFLAGNRRRYGLIQIPLGESLSGASSGSRSLGSSDLFTVETLSALLQALEPEGVLVATLWLKIPPRENLKLFATLLASLRQVGVEDPQAHVAQIRGWGTVATLVKRSPLGAADRRQISEYAAQRSFDTSWMAGREIAHANESIRLQEPWVYQGNLRIAAAAEEFFSDYKFDIRPATEDRPFFFHSFRWRTLPELLRIGSGAGLPLIEWGHLIVVATLIQAVLASAVLILLPLRWVRQRATGSAHNLRVLVYFASIGLGFMILELAFFEQLALYLGHPTYALVAVLTAFMVAAGLGSAFTRSRSAPMNGRATRVDHPCLIVVLVGLVIWLGLPKLLSATLALPVLARFLVALVALGPLGFVLGMPFPVGLARAAARRSIWLPWAWGINGSASVVGAASVPLLALHLGFSNVILVGLLFYGLAAACATSSRPWARALGIGQE